MQFLLNEEQRLIQESLDRVLVDMRGNASIDDRAAVTQQLAELGLLGAALPEQVDGSGGGPVEQAVIAQRLGHHLASSSYLSTAVLGAEVLKAAGTDYADEQLRRIVAGDAVLALALYEQEQRYEFSNLKTSMQDGVLNGTKHYVLDGGVANTLIVAATKSASKELVLLAIDPTTPGVTVRPYDSVDGTPLATAGFNGVAVTDAQIIGQGAQAQTMLENALAMGVFAISADILGACEAALTQTVEYLKVREQFGRALHTFQALQHRASDQHAEIEMLRSLVLGAGQTLSDGLNASSRSDALAAGVMAAQVGDHVGREAIQMHGAIGMTADLGVGKYLMRANTLTRLFGDLDNYRDRFIQCIEETAA